MRAQPLAEKSRWLPPNPKIQGTHFSVVAQFNTDLSNDDAIKFSLMPLVVLLLSIIL